MELTPECTLVASGYLGFGITDPWDGHAYLLRVGDEAILLDSGCGRDTDAIIRRIEPALAGARLNAIALTHGHIDHAGGAAELARHFDVPVHGSPELAARLASADEEAIGLRSARDAGIYPPDLTLDAVPGIRTADGIRVGDRELRAIPTPGHSADHVAYAIDLPEGRAVFSGDLVFAQGRAAILDTPDTDEALYARSVRSLADIEADQLFPGHGAVVIRHGRDHIRAAAAAFDRGERPVGIVA